MAKFLIKGENKKGSAKIFVRVRKYRDGEVLIDTIIGTDLEVNKKRWKSAVKSKNTWDTFKIEGQYIELVKQLDLISSTVDDMLESNVYDKTSYRDAINNITKHTARSIQKEEEERMNKKTIAYKRSVLHYCDYFITGIKDGSILHGKENKRYTEGTIKNWTSFRKYWCSFDNKRGLEFSDINISIYNKFVSYLRKTGLMNKSITKNIICARKLCNQAFIDGVNTNSISLTVWTDCSSDNNVTRVRTYLSEEELNALYKLDLNKGSELDKVRDMFCMECFLCQRFSDIMNMKKSNFDNYDTDGTQYYKVNQIKTGSCALVLFTEKRKETKYIKEICKKYNYQFPLGYTDQSFNRYLKIILRKLSETVPTLNTTFATVLSSAERRSNERSIKENGKPLYEVNEEGSYVKPKWDIITSHSGRRTGITLEYERGILTLEQIMIMSGHQSVDQLLHYVTMTDKQKELDKISKLKAAYK
jgi:hypothetical protein